MDVLIHTASQLLVLFIIMFVFVVGGFFIQDRYLLAIVVLICATPAASVGTMMSFAYEGDTMSMARGTFLTTVMSLVTLPLIALIVV